MGVYVRSNATKEGLRELIKHHANEDDLVDSHALDIASFDGDEHENVDEAAVWKAWGCESREAFCVWRGKCDPYLEERQFQRGEHLQWMHSWMVAQRSSNEILCWF